MPRVVLVGGPADGMRKFVDQPYPILKVMEVEKFDPLRKIDMSIPGVMTERRTIDYEYMEFFGIGFYIHRGMRKDLLIQKLLAGYYPND